MVAFTCWLDIGIANYYYIEKMILKIILFIIGFFIGMIIGSMMAYFILIPILNYLLEKFIAPLFGYFNKKDESN
jgi:phage shock protein PspC (stress-responsive transcriptional regulator)